MAPTEETPPERYYWVQLPPSGGTTPPPIRIRADTICGRINAEYGIIELKLDGQIVAKLQAPITGWWIETVAPESN